MKRKENNRPQYDETEAAGICEDRNQKLEKIRLIKKYFGWKNADIAKLLNSTPNNIKSRLSPSSKQNLPVWVDAFIGMFETLKPDTLPRIKNLETSFKDILDENKN